MKFVIEKPTMNAANYFRRAGYFFQKRDGEEMVFVRKLTDQEFPRFHAFVKVVGFSAKGGSVSGGKFEVSIHIDHKRTSYHGSHAHSGEYDNDSKLLQDEAERLKAIS